MTKYTLLNRRMNSEYRISQRKLVVIIIVTFILFLYALNRNSSSCDNDESLSKESQHLDNTNLPIIYAVTPTYYRPVQKAELTRYMITTSLLHEFFSCDLCLAVHITIIVSLTFFLFYYKVIAFISFGTQPVLGELLLLTKFIYLIF